MGPGLVTNMKDVKKRFCIAPGKKNSKDLKHTR